jgi:glyoxylase-like metal-dependent hydrolase (beta-lactamase superfamily II)
MITDDSKGRHFTRRKHMLEVARRSQVRLGDTTVTYLPDGEVHLDPAALFPASGPDGWSRYAPYLDPDGRLPVSVGSFLVRTPRHRLLIDLGLGTVDFEIPGMASFRGGALLQSLAQEGLEPAEIDVVVFTHLHHDHVGWTTDVAPAPNSSQGKQVSGLTFSRARHLVDSREWGYWNGTAEIVGPDPDAVQKPLASVIEFVRADAELVPGVLAVPTPGHTPGHLSVLISDPAATTQLLVLGDVMHTQAQVSETHWNFRFDVDPAVGTRTRIDLLAQFQDDRTIIAGGHFAGNVFGRFLPPRRQYGWSSST